MDVICVAMQKCSRNEKWHSKDVDTSNIIKKIVTIILKVSLTNSSKIWTREYHWNSKLQFVIFP